MLLIQLKVYTWLIVDPLLEVGWGEWDDEVRDKRTAYMEVLITAGHIFKKVEWLGGDKSLPLLDYKPKQTNVVHKKHIVSRKKKGKNHKHNAALVPRKRLQKQRIQLPAIDSNTWESPATQDNLTMATFELGLRT